jgi:hypothetical protein
MMSRLSDYDRKIVNDNFPKGNMIERITSPFYSDSVYGSTRENNECEYEAYSGNPGILVSK